MASSSKKDLKKVIAALQKQGWRVEQTRDNHYRFYAPNGRDMIHCGGTESDHRALQNTIARLRRAGFRG